jgi:hypothetical protein
MTLDINTILHTKDGRRIGNAIIIKREGYYWTVKTDYGSEVMLTSEEIDELFYIAYSNLNKETDGYSCEETQAMMQSDHKHRVNN